MSSLDRYLADREDHEKTEQRDITLESNPTVDDICRRYEEWLEELTATSLASDYPNGLKHLKGLEYAAQEVREFSLRLKQYEDAEYFQDTGLFLSALMNTCSDEEFEILTEHLETQIDYIGYKNTKLVSVSGDVGDRVGEHMASGSITVNGNAGDKVGEEMTSGSIIVNGNAGKWVGNQMKNGSIMVNGNARRAVGHCMEGGSVRIEGEMGPISEWWEGGEIYHRGKRVRPE